MAADAKSKAPEQDEFETTSSAFLTLKDFEGCLVAYLSHGVEEIPTKTKNANAKKDTFSVYKSVLVFLDGKPSEAVGDPEPGETFEEFGISGAFNERLCKETMRKKKPKIARIVVEKNNVGTMSAKLSDPKDGDVEIARKYREAISGMKEIAFPDPFED